MGTDSCPIGSSSGAREKSFWYAEIRKHSTILSFCQPNSPFPQAEEGGTQDVFSAFSLGGLFKSSLVEDRGSSSVFPEVDLPSQRSSSSELCSCFPVAY